MKMAKVSSILLLSSTFKAVHAWGCTGHMLVNAIAYANIQSTTNAAVVSERPTNLLIPAKIRDFDYGSQVNPNQAGDAFDEA